MNNLRTFPPKFLQKPPPPIFFMVYLLHRLYGVDAPASINNVPGKYMDNRISFLTSKWLESASEYSMLCSSTRYNRVSDEPRGHSHERSVVCDR